MRGASSVTWRAYRVKDQLAAQGAAHAAFGLGVGKPGIAARLRQCAKINQVSDQVNKSVEKIGLAH